jgi:hypothetical protein
MNCRVTFVLKQPLLHPEVAHPMVKNADRGFRVECGLRRIIRMTVLGRE